MQDIIHMFSGKLRWLLFGIFTLIVPILVYSLLLPAALTSANIAPATLSTTTTKPFSSPKNGTADRFTQSLISMDKTINDSRRTIGTTFSRGGELAGNGIVRGVVNTGRFIGNTASLTGRAAKASFSFIIGLPGAVVGSVTSGSAVRAIITPPDNTQLPVIEPSKFQKATKQSVLPEVKTPVREELVTRWPITGRITTHFGVPHWPFQPVHTGLDISDGKGSGTTPIKPFSSGIVKDIVYSYSGLGNHVIIDHGDGITSLYGHMASISVNEKQAVDLNTVLGYVGSTGVSTGTHLHFEIMQDGRLVDPRQFIDGQP